MANSVNTGSDLPGFYYDVARNRYFKLTNDFRPPLPQPAAENEDESTAAGRPSSNVCRALIYRQMGEYHHCRSSWHAFHERSALGTPLISSFSLRRSKVVPSPLDDDFAISCRALAANRSRNFVAPVWHFHHKSRHWGRDEVVAVGLTVGTNITTASAPADRLMETPDSDGWTERNTSIPHSREMGDSIGTTHHFILRDTERCFEYRSTFTTLMDANTVQVPSDSPLTSDEPLMVVMCFLVDQSSLCRIVRMDRQSNKLLADLVFHGCTAFSCTAKQTSGGSGLLRVATGTETCTKWTELEQWEQQQSNSWPIRKPSVSLFTEKRSVFCVRFKNEDDWTVVNGLRNGDILCHDLRNRPWKRFSWKMKANTLPVHQVELLSDVYNPFRMVVAGQGNCLVQADLRMPRKVVQEYRGHVNEDSREVRFSVDEEADVLCSTGSDFVTRLWRLSDGKLLTKIPYPHLPGFQKLCQWGVPQSVFRGSWGHPRLINTPALVINYANQLHVYEIHPD